ncbi:MAG: hypothetical protein AAF488_01475 [Planctomycetota bacterium]
MTMSRIASWVCQSIPLAIVVFACACTGAVFSQLAVGLSPVNPPGSKKLTVDDSSSDALPLDAELAQHGELVTSLAFHPKKSQLATLDRNGDVRIWDTKGWKTVRRLRSFSSEHGAICYSRNGRLLAVGGDGGITIWSVRGWKQIREIPLDGDRFVSTSTKKPLDLDSVRALRFSPDGRQLFAGGNSKTIYSWHTKDWSRAPAVRGHRPMKNSPQPDVPIDKLPPGTLPPGVTLKDANLNPCTIEFLEFSAKSKALISGGLTHQLRLWRWRQDDWHAYAKHAERLAPAYPSDRMDARVSRDGKLLAVAVGDGRIELIETKQGKLTHDFEANPGTFVTSVEFSRDGQKIYATGDGLKTWNAETKTLLKRQPLAGTGRMIRRSHDGKLLAVSCEDQVVRVFRTGGG